MKKWIIAAAFGGILTVAVTACPMHGGKISDIDVEKNRITLMKGEDMATFRVPPSQTKLTIDGKAATFAELKVGDTVNVNYNPQQEVASIEVTRS